MSPNIVVVGCGGFGREVADLALELEERHGGAVLLGVVDDGPSPADLHELEACGVTYLGTVDAYLAGAEPAGFVIGIANPRVRRMLDTKFTDAGHTAAVLVHPSVTVGRCVDIGDGSILCAGARLTTSIRLGRHTHVNLNATIGHDAVLGDYVTIFPAAAVSGHVRLGDEVSLGVGSAVLQGLEVGQRTFVGAAALVTRDIGPDLVVKGVPAR